MVSDAAATKAPIAKIADKVSGVFVPIVIAIAICTFAIWMIAGESVGFSLARAISVLVISCPCALGLATPVAIMVGNGVGAKNGILFKNAVTLEQTGKVNAVVLDKTGTITSGKMCVQSVILASGIDEEKLISLAASIESKSEHPISKAITTYAKERKFLAKGVTDFTVVPGKGLIGNVGGDVIYGGNREFIEENCGINLSLIEAFDKAMESSRQGKTPIFFSTSTSFLGAIVVSDMVKPYSAYAIEQLKKLGLQVIMLTGDNEITANAVAKEVGVDSVIASVKPDGKEQVIKELSLNNKVMMVGDGINDAPALTRADIGVAIGAGTDIAIDAADIVLTKNSLMDVALAIKISKATIRNIHENLFWAFFYNVIGIPLAAGCFIKAFGLTLNPMVGAAAMSLSSFCVVTNALRLNLIRVYDRAESDNEIEPEININTEEETIMKIEVKGMMCAHCEAHVKAALEKVEGIVEANANHDDNMVVITTSAPVDETSIKAAVDAAGYEYCGIVE